MARIKLYDIRWVSHTAGPSPVSNEFGPNCRVELFFMGCKKAAAGNPCPDCFNPKLWNDISDKTLEPKDMVRHLEEVTNLRYLTIVGGEPLDQAEGLLELCEELRAWHKIVFTHYTMSEIPKDIRNRLINCVDIIVDGSYIREERIYDESLRDGFHDAVGSGNQVVWDCARYQKFGKLLGYSARDILQLSLTEFRFLLYRVKLDAKPIVLERI